jgi:hypothetical protein
MYPKMEISESRETDLPKKYGASGCSRKHGAIYRD